MAEAESIPKPRGQRRRRWLYWGLGALLAVVAGAVVQFFLDPVSAVRLDLRLRALRRAGEVLTRADVAAALPSPPPRKNAAVLYAEAAKLTGAASLPWALEQQLPVLGPAKLPPRGEPLPAAMRAAIGQCLAIRKPVLSLLHQAADIAECRFALPFAEDGLNPTFPEFFMRNAAPLLAIEALDLTERGQPDEAADSIRAALRVGHAARASLSDYAPYYAAGAESGALRQLDRLLARHRLSSQSLTRLDDVLRAADVPALAERLLVAERAWAGDPAWATRFASCQEPVPLAVWLGMTPAPVLDCLVRKISVPNAPARTDRLYYLIAHTAVLDALRAPMPTRFRDAERVAEQKKGIAPLRCRVAYATSATLGIQIEAAASSMARIETARVALAALRCHARGGKPPDGLASLVPDFLESVPLDPFSGASLRFLPEADGFVVYSVGRDGQDDAGKLDTDLPVWQSPCDIGFRVRWPQGR